MGTYQRYGKTSLSKKNTPSVLHKTNAKRKKPTVNDGMPDVGITCAFGKISEY